MRIVLDTNVIVSGLLSPFGVPARVLEIVASGRAGICYDSRILAEYREVLARPKFPFDPAAVMEFLDSIAVYGIRVIGMPLDVSLPDPSDLMFLEAAVAADAEFLVSGNLRHFPASACADVRVISPSEFLRVTQGENK